MRNRIVWVLALAFLSAFSQSVSYSAQTAKAHVGETATVCGTVVGGHYAATTRGRPTFIDFDSAYPNADFTALIWGENRSKFGSPEVEWRNERVCVTGLIQAYRGTPEIILSDPAQVRAGTSSPLAAEGTATPSGATAICRDGAYSFSAHRSGTCSHHGGVAKWLAN